MQRLAGGLLAAFAFCAAFVMPAGAQPRDVVATDFTVQLFMTEKGELSPDIFKLEELAVHNFTVSGFASNFARKARS